MGPASQLADELVLLEPDAQGPVASCSQPWKIMVVDDDADVHDATQLALATVRFRNRGLSFVHAYSAAEACQLLEEHNDVAVMLLDVVMETDDAGLRAIQLIRAAGHEMVRVVLRTGHPGYVPQQEVVVSYDIHSYLEKASLDFTRLFSALISALRAYDDLLKIEQHRQSVVTILDTVSWFDFRSLRRYLSRMLAELASIAGIDIENLVLAMRSSQNLVAEPTDAQAPFVQLVDCITGSPLSDEERTFIAKTFDQGAGGSSPHGSTYHRAAFGVELVVFSRDPQAMEQADLTLLEMLLAKIAQALDNHDTFSTILSERDSLMRSFVMQGEQWGGHDAHELESIQTLSRKTAALLRQQLHFTDEIDDWFIFSISTACSFHDVGLREVPHRLFESEGALSPEDRALMRHHADAGVELLRERMSGLLGSRLYAMAEAIIHEHHERHDGSGYPAGLSGEAISVAARISGVTDTYVAMTSARPWRPALSPDEAIAYIRAQRDVLFDSRVVDAFLEAVADPY